MTCSTPKNSQYHITAGNDAVISSGSCRDRSTVSTNTCTVMKLWLTMSGRASLSSSGSSRRASACAVSREFVCTAIASASPAPSASAAPMGSEYGPAGMPWSGSRMAVGSAEAGCRESGVGFRESAVGDQRYGKRIRARCWRSVIRFRAVDQSFLYLARRIPDP